MSQSPPGGWPDPQQPASSGWADPQPHDPAPAGGGWPDQTQPTFIAGASSQQPVGYPAPAANSAPPQPLYPGSMYGVPPTTPPGYGYQPPAFGYPAAPKTNALAVASLVISLVAAVGLCGYGIGGLLGVVGAIMGHVGRRQIRERGESGDGMALAGVIIGWIALALGLLIIAAFVLIVVLAINADGTV